MLLLSRLNSLSKVKTCFLMGFLCFFLCPLEAHERKKGSANLPTELLRLFVLNTSTHNQPTILQDFLPCVFLALRNHFKHSFEDVLRPNSVNFLLHNLKIQPLIICIPLALHWIVCDV